MHEELFELMLLFVMLPITLVTSSQFGDTVELEFRAYRLQHFDLQGVQNGSRAWRVMYEAVALDSKTLLRRCLVTLWRDLIGRDLDQILDRTLAATIIVIPADLDTLSGHDRQNFYQLERDLLSRTYEMPIYVAPSTEQLRKMMQTLQTARRVEYGSALTALLHAVTVNSFQIQSKFQGGSVAIDQPMFNVVGRLSAFERGADMSTIAIVAHYDAFGVAPALSFGADSNASGVAALLELLRIFHRFYQNTKTRPKYNLVFVLSAGGKLNYQGIRQWIEEYLEQSHGKDESTSIRLELAICLDSLGLDSSLRMHVSKLPSSSSPVDRLLVRLRKASTVRFGLNRSVDIVSKKINLVSELLAWEHERFTIRRLPACTLSHYNTSMHDGRRSILDTQVDLSSLTINVQVIADALLMYLYNLSDINLSSPSSPPIFLDSSTGVRKDLLKVWMNTLLVGPRAVQTTTPRGTQHPLVANLLNTFDHYTDEARLSPVVADKKDPEFVLFGGTEDLLVAYRVKPAVFELVLALIIIAYLALVYLVTLNVQTLIQHVHSTTGRLKSA